MIQLKYWSFGIQQQSHTRLQCEHLLCKKLAINYLPDLKIFLLFYFISKLYNNTIPTFGKLTPKKTNKNPTIKIYLTKLQIKTGTSYFLHCKYCKIYFVTSLQSKIFCTIYQNPFNTTAALDNMISVSETIITHIVNIDICEIEKNQCKL